MLHPIARLISTLNSRLQTINRLAFDLTLHTARPPCPLAKESRQCRIEHDAVSRCELAEKIEHTCPKIE